MKYLSLFSGIGGFELGIQQAYENMDNRRIAGTSELAVHRDLPNSDPSDGNGRRTDPVCIGYSEIDKYAVQIYQKHFPDHKNYGDITKIDPATLSDFDLICGGFPCQAFSIAGKRGGFEDTRGTLFFDIARIIRVKRPRYIFLENVKGLLSHDEGNTFATIIATIDELGYDCQWQVLNSKNFGVPQNRERVFIIGHLRGTTRPQVFPLGRDSENNTEQQKLREITSRKSQSARVYKPDGIAQTISSGGGKTGLYAVPAQWRRTEKGKAFRKEAQKKGKDLTPFNDGHRELVPKDSNIIGTITSQAIAKDSLLFEPDMKIRRLTPTECERLQGFPDGWTEGISDTQRYKCLGNAVTVNVIKEIAKRLI